MSASLKTTFYNLAKYAANDITSWLTDFNGNMDKIDTALNQNKTAAQTAQDGVDNLESEYETVTQTLATHTNQISANEKAIAANTTSITSLGKKVDNIIIGDYIAWADVDLNITEPLMNGINVWFRRIGNGVQAGGGFTLNAGTVHRYDRQIPSGIFTNLYFTDFFRINGNPLNLPENVYCPISAKAVNYTSGTVLSEFNYSGFALVYLPESGYTVFGIVGGNSSQYTVPGLKNMYVM